MNKRKFLKLLALSGLGTAFPVGAGLVSAQTVNKDRRFFVTISADGGWDTTCLFDPKGKLSGVNDVDLDSSLITADGIRWSAIPEIEDQALIEEQYRNFFTQYSSQLTAIRGVDSLTTSHVLGMKGTWSGNFGTNPVIGALYGAVHGEGLPLSYVTFGGLYGGNDYTAGLKVTKTRLKGGDLIQQIAQPNFGQRDAIYNMVSRAHTERLNNQVSKELEGGKGLILRAKRMEQLLEQRMQPNAFALLYENMSQLESEETFPGDWNEGRSEALKGQARIAAASFATGVTSSASLNMGGFDTHNNNKNQYPQLGNFLEGIHYLIEALKFYGIEDQTVIMVASDIGRLPFFNPEGGKDHYNLSGQMIIHPKSSGFGGNYFGESTAGFEGQKINHNTGRKDLDGKILTTRDTLNSMRKYLLLEDTPAAREFPLNTDSMPKILG